MHDTPTLADWVSALSLGVSGIALIAFALAFADADASYFDPRRLLDTDAGARVVVAFFNAKATVRDACLDVAALIVLLTTSPKGAMA